VLTKSINIITKLVFRKIFIIILEQMKEYIIIIKVSSKVKFKKLKGLGNCFS